MALSNPRPNATTLRERARSGAIQGTSSAAVAIIAWWPPHLLMLQQGFWAAITAIAVLQSQLQAARGPARDQVVGAAIGGTIAIATGFTIGQTPVAWALAIAVAGFLCWLLDVPSASRLAGITVIIILLVPHQGSTGRFMLARVFEVAWGVTVALSFARIVQGRTSPEDGPH